MAQLPKSKPFFTEQFSSKLYEKNYEIEINDYKSYIFPSNISSHSIEDNYLILNFNYPVIKLGYICSPNGIGNDEKIWLRVKDEYSEKWRAFEIGKTGIFEYQVESMLFTDEESNLVEKDIGIYVYGIKIPLYNKESKIDFSINYSYLKELIDF